MWREQAKEEKQARLVRESLEKAKLSAIGQSETVIKSGSILVQLKCLQNWKHHIKLEKCAEEIAHVRETVV